MHEYFNSELPKTNGLPTVQYCADKVCLSPNYFGDLIKKKETGKTASEHIQLAVLSKVKEQLTETDNTISEIAYDLGFNYPPPTILSLIHISDPTRHSLNTYAGIC